MSTSIAPFGGALRARRLIRGLTLEHLAAEVGISIAQLSHLELGRRAPSPEHAAALAAALALRPAERRHWLMLAGLAHVPCGLREAVVAALRKTPCGIGKNCP